MYLYLHLILTLALNPCDPFTLFGTRSSLLMSFPNPLLELAFLNSPSSKHLYHDPSSPSPTLLNFPPPTLFLPATSLLFSKPNPLYRCPFPTPSLDTPPPLYLKTFFSEPFPLCLFHHNLAPPLQVHPPLPLPSNPLTSPLYDRSV